MSQSTSREEQMRAVYQAFLAGEFTVIAEQLHPDVEYVNPDDAVEPGTRFGAEEFVTALRRLHEFFDFEAIEIGEFVERGDEAGVVVRFITHGRESAIRLELDFGHLLTWGGRQDPPPRVVPDPKRGDASAGRAGLAYVEDLDRVGEVEARRRAALDRVHAVSS